jgi:type VII secretion-associated serine protease mycosin
MKRVAAVALVLVAVFIPAAVSAPPVGASTRDAVRDAEYWLDAYGIRDAWAVTRGAGVTIAIIDTGVAGGVRDLAGAVIGGADFSGAGSADGQTPVGSEAPHHGTMVASLAAGRGTGRTSGVIGAAPEASILSISIGLGEGIDDSDQQVADAVVWAVDNGADVINMSFTRNELDWPESWDAAFLYAAEHDVVIVAAAGNRGSGTEQVGAPATMPGVLTVAGVDRAGVVSADASSQGITISVAAPSESLVGVRPDGRYVSWAGTSGAAPIVSGIVALVRAAHPELDAANVINRVIATARDAGPPGNDFTYGFGYIDARAAVSATVPHVSENPMGDLAEWVRLYRRADAPEQPVVVVVPEVESQPQVDYTDPTGILLPRIVTLQLVGLPLLAFVLLTAGATVFVVVAVRRIRASRSR